MKVYYERLFMAVLVLIVMAEAYMLFDQRMATRRLHLAYSVFRVIDADSQTPITDFVLTFPEISSQDLTLSKPGELTFLRGPDFSVVMSAVLHPVLFGISKKGYQDATLEISPRRYESLSSVLPGNVETVVLRKKANN